MPKSVERPLLHGTGEALPLPDKPSIAVLAFTNMSGDPEQEYFSDGIADDIITELSRSRSLFVIARNSSFTYKGRAVDVKQVAANWACATCWKAACVAAAAGFASPRSLSTPRPATISGQNATIAHWKTSSRCRMRSRRRSSRLSVPAVAMRNCGARCASRRRTSVPGRRISAVVARRENEPRRDEQAKHLLPALDRHSTPRSLGPTQPWRASSSTTPRRMATRFWERTFEQAVEWARKAIALDQDDPEAQGRHGVPPRRPARARQLRVMRVFAMSDYFERDYLKSVEAARRRLARHPDVSSDIPVACSGVWASWTE